MTFQFSSREQILANLHGERARFLQAIYGLTEAQLQMPLWDDWTSSSLLPHIALWDASEADRLHKIAVGQANQIQNIDVDEQNAIWHAQHSDMAVDDGVAMLVKERTRFLAALDAISDEQLKATYTTQHSRHFSPLSCTKNGIEHDQDHAQDVLAWRAQNELEAAVQGPKSILIALMWAGLRDFEATAALVEARVSAETPICGHWNLTQLIAHMASWETYVLKTIEQMKADPVADGDAAIDLENEQLVNERLHLPLSDIWDEYHTARKRLIELIGNMSDKELTQPIADAWVEENTPYGWCYIWVVHEMEHAQELRALLDAEHIQDKAD